MEEKWWHAFVPKMVICLREKYSWALFRQDLFAGMTVGVVALPLALAFAIASGVAPERGLFTAVIAGFLVSLLGGSRVQIGGPAGALVVIIYGIIQRAGYEGLVVATLLAAGMLIVMAFCRFGNLIKYFPMSLIQGLMTGLGVIVFSLQIKDFFGLPIGELPIKCLSKWSLFIKHFPCFDLMTMGMGLGTLALILIFRRFLKQIPWGIGAIALATLVSICCGFSIETIHSRFGDMPRMLPAPFFPALSWEKIYWAIPDACAIALLGGIESLLSAVVGDNLTGHKHKSNCELLAQGVANMAAVLFGGIPATGTIGRTATNVHSGAVTPISGMVHAITLLVLMFFFSPIVGYIPMSALAAVLVIVAWNLAEPHRFIEGCKKSKIEIVIMLATFSLTVLANVLTGVIVGMGIWLCERLFQKWKSPASLK